MRRRPMLGWAFVGASALVIAGCTGDPEPTAPTAPPTQAAITAPDVSATPQSAIAAAVPAHYIATAPGVVLDVYDAAGGEIARTIEATDVLTAPDRTPLTFLVKEMQGDWAEVYLPIRPNGATGWIPVDSVTMTATDFDIQVSLADFTLTLYDGDDAVLTTAVGIGRDDRPTPGGTYYIRELLQPPNADGPYGPYAYGLSGFSPVLDSFKGGEAIIGIHGTDQPSSIGGYVSSGCIRIPNEVVTRLVSEFGVPLGTPVHISA